MSQIIEVKRGVPFQVFPRLDTVEESYVNGDLLQTFPLHVSVLGTGNLCILRDTEILTEAANSLNSRCRLITPLGSIRGEWILTDEGFEFVKTSAPLLVTATLDNLSYRQAARVRFDLIIGSQRYTSKPDLEDEYEKYRAQFFNWVDPKTGENSELFFPQDPVIFSRIKFAFRSVRVAS